MRLAPIVSLLALLLGTTLVGYGLFAFVGASGGPAECQMDYVTVAGAPDNASGESLASAVPYGRLSLPEQSAFVASLNTNATVQTTDAVFEKNTTYVKYNSSFYAVESTENTTTDCPTSGSKNDAVGIAMLLGGLFFIGIGGVGLVRYFLSRA